MIRISILFFVLVSQLTFAEDKKVTSQQISQTIRKVHADLMNQHFIEVRNLANKQKNYRRFLAEAFGVEDTSDLLKGIPVDEATPTITLIKNGILIKESGGKQLSLVLGMPFGSAEMKTVDSGKAKNAWWRDLYPLPTAEAGVWRWLGQGVNWLVEGQMGLRQVGKNWVDLSAAERVASVAKGTAYMTAQGAAGGCIVGLHLGSPDQTALNSCAAGAALGAALLFSSSGGTLVGIQAAERYAKLSPEIKQKIVTGIRYMSGVGLAAGLAHGGDSLLKSDGAKLICRSDKSFRLVDLSLSEQSRDLISVEGDYFNFAGDNWRTPSVAREPEALKARLKTNEKYGKLDDEALTLLANGILTDLKKYSDKCKKHGAGFTEAYRLERDKPAIEAGKQEKPSTTK